MLCVNYIRLTFVSGISDHPAEVDAELNLYSIVSSGYSKEVEY